LSDLGWNSLDFAIVFVVIGHRRPGKLDRTPLRRWIVPPYDKFLSGA
jgi:hypothetical protein